MAEYGFFIPSAGRTRIAGLLAGETLEISRVMVTMASTPEPIHTMSTGPRAILGRELRITK